MHSQRASHHFACNSIYYITQEILPADLFYRTVDDYPVLTGTESEYLTC